MLILLQLGIAVFSPVNSNVYSCFATQWVQWVILATVSDRKRSKKPQLLPYARKRASGRTADFGNLLSAKIQVYISTIITIRKK